MTQIKTVAIAGANGSLGSVIFDTLAASGAYDIVVIKRAGSKSPLPSSPHSRVVEVSDNWTTQELTEAMRGLDAAIACWPLKDVNQHIRFADAAAAAGVRRFIPADYGSVDSRSAYACELVPLFGRKGQVRARLQELAGESNGAFSWTSLVNGHLFDWGMANGFLHFYPDEKRAEILGDGNAKSSNVSMVQVARAVMRIFERLDQTANRVLMVQSFCVSQNDTLHSLERVTGEKWKVEHVGIDEFVEKHKARVDAGHSESTEDLVFALGVIEGNWEEKEDFAMDLLGLQNEDLDEVVRKSLKK